jgi:hypothetical protein
LCDTSLDLPEDGKGIEDLTHILRRGDLYDLDETKFDINVNDCAMGDEGEGDMAVALPVFIQVLRLAVMVLVRV